MRDEHASDELRRLSALDVYDILDTPSEPTFDDIARLAAQLFDAPFAAVSFVTAERVWFKARHDLVVAETPHRSSFCAQTILNREIFVVEDARADARFADSLLVAVTPQVRFYAGAPVWSAEGFALGAVCVFDSEPRRLRDGEAAALNALAAQVAAHLASRRRIRELEAAVGDSEQTARELARVAESLRGAEEQLRHSRRIEAVGRLAGGIAHNFNNILAIVMLHCDLMLRELGEGHPLRLRATEIKTAAQRAADLTRQLLAFGRRQLLQPKKLDLNAVVNGAQMMLKHVLGGVELVTDLDENLYAVEADEGQLEQVLANLAANAAEAMEYRGTLSIGTRNETITGGIVRDEAHLAPGDYAALRVSDTGAGVDEETRRHIFEPFLMTNQAGDGPGLSLSVVYGIVKQSGGYIFAASEPTGGNTFTIYLPRAAAEVTPAQVPHHAVEDAGAAFVSAGRVGVLVVDDEPQVRMLVRETLAEAGYEVLEAASGEDALALCSDERNGFELLLTDVEMRKMDGWELARRIVAEKPHVSVIFMSGHIANEESQSGVNGAATSFLHKPFSPDELERAIADALDKG